MSTAPGAPVAELPRSGKLGPVLLTALVVGNMVGSGVFLLPASLAPFGGASLLGWVVTAGGSMALGLVIARLARRHPGLGGPYAYTRAAFGDFAGFLVGWGYWISCWCAQAAIAVAMVGYLGELVPAATASPANAAGTAIGAIVLLTGVNVAGVRNAGGVQLVTTVLKLLPLVAIALFGFSRFDPELLRPFTPPDRTLPSAVQGCLALTLWAFLGFESASVATLDARDPRRDVPRATVLGVAIAAVLYIVCTTAVLGLIPREELAVSNAPFAAAAARLWGDGAARLIAAGAFVSCFGALNGWTLVAGQTPLAIARDGLFPASFGRLSSRGTPTFGLVLSSGLACALVAANSAGTLAVVFGGMILLSTLSALIALIFCAMADFHLTLRERRAGTPERTAPALLVASLAFAYALLAIAGADTKEVAWGFLLLLGGMPFYALARS